MRITHSSLIIFENNWDLNEVKNVKKSRETIMKLALKRKNHVLSTKNKTFTHLAALVPDGTVAKF